MQVVLTDRARSDLMSIVTYVAKHNVSAAQKLHASAFDALTALSQSPRRGRPGRVENTREIVLHPSYVAAYRVNGDTVEILTIQHTARHWPEAF